MHHARARGERALFARLDAGDPHARDALVERFLPLARSLARRYEHSGEPLDDLVQVASLALINAIDRFDSAKGCAFSTFAVPTILGELKRHLRDRAWIVRPPRRLQELTSQVQLARGQLSLKLHRAPTISELAAAVDSDEDQILEALQTRGSRAAISLQAPAGGHDDQSALQDTLGSPDRGLALAELRVVLDGLTDGLSSRSREVLHLRFDRDMTQRQIGEQLGVSTPHVNRLIGRALTRMRHAASETTSDSISRAA